jgi:hypothetical protein
MVANNRVGLKVRHLAAAQVGAVATHSTCRFERLRRSIKKRCDWSPDRFRYHSSRSVQPSDRGYGIEAVAWFEYALSTLLESTAVVT